MLAGKYRVESVLGEGGMGSVYKATHLLVGESVALKLLRADLAVLPEASARFLREAKTAMRLKSENVARVLDVGTLDGGDPYIAIELLEGSDLGKRLDERGPLSSEEAVDLTLQACHALAEAHAAGVVHRDIKPANLFLTRDAVGRRVLKLLDFGISKLRDEATPITKTSAVMGSVPYMSPEQLESSKHVDERSDIYSLGVTLYELLTGTLPFEGETMPQVCASILKGRPVDILERREGLPKELGSVVHRAFAPEPKDRPATVVALAASLLPFASGAGRAYAQRIPGIGVESPPSVPPPGPKAEVRQAKPGSLEETLPAPAPPEPSLAAPAMSAARRSSHDTDVTLAAPSRVAPARRALWVGAAAVAAVASVSVFLLTREGGGPGAASPAHPEASPAHPEPEASAADPSARSTAPIDVAASVTVPASKASGEAVPSAVASAGPRAKSTAAGRPLGVTKTAAATAQATAPPAPPTAASSSGVWGRN